MIRYHLICQDGHSFDGWFCNSDAFDEQAAQGQVSCPFCGSSEVSKAVMAPNISIGETRERPSLEDKQDHQDMSAMIRKVRDHIEANADYVGDRFANEARKIHYEETEARGIYGEATVEDVKELHEEGITCHQMPQLPEDQN
ncbi:MAG: DUF1178 family protein [Methyloligellaceae bacterium]